ncbi:hypothetical protein [Peribacillus sp. NJ4]|uniref:hypothetical protein n=1 Tax=Peribacillus sp. NJ4 TaxID=3055862 RepID=UPI0025A0D2FC|nr:hypothetical protein [Peribacillus sp. NJ4]
MYFRFETISICAVGSLIGGTLSHEVIFVQRSQMPLMILAAISAASANFILNKVTKKYLSGRKQKERTFDP